MDDETKIGPHTKVINLENYNQHQLLEFLRKIVDVSRLYTPSKECIIKEFPGFRKLRMTNIENFKILAEITCNRCNAVYVTGASAGIRGSVDSFGELPVLTMATGCLGAALLVTEKDRGRTSLGTFATQGLVVKVQLEKILELLKQDKDYFFRRVLPFVEDTLKLPKAVEELMNFSVFQKMMESIVSNPDVVNAIGEERPMQELPQGMKDFINDLPISANEKQQMRHMLLEVMGSGEGIQLFRHIFDFFRREKPSISNIYNNLSTEYACSDMGRALRREASTLLVHPASVVAMEVLFFVSDFKDMNHDFRSKLATKAREATDLLKRELYILQKICDV